MINVDAVAKATTRWRQYAITIGSPHFYKQSFSVVDGDEQFIYRIEKEWSEKMSFMAC
jgi:hypothetical protein